MGSADNALNSIVATGAYIIEVLVTLTDNGFPNENLCCHNICYCIEPGVQQDTGDTYASKDETFWDNLPSDINSTISPYDIKLFIGRIMQYGYTGPISTSWRSQNPADAATLAEAMELMLALFNIVQGTISTIMSSAGFGSPQQTVLPAEMITTIEDCGFFESIPLWAVTLIGGLFITVMSFILIMTVYGRFFKLYMYTALAPIPLSTFAGEPSQNVGKSFIKSYCAVCLEGAVIVLSCIIFSLFASSPPVVNPDAAAVTQVWSYIGELLFNMLVLVGSVKMSDRIIREMMGL